MLHRGRRIRLHAAAAAVVGRRFNEAAAQRVADTAVRAPPVEAEQNIIIALGLLGSSPDKPTASRQLSEEMVLLILLVDHGREVRTYYMYR